MSSQTICAIATATGGAIGTVRVSGQRAIEITSEIFHPLKAGKRLTECNPYSLTFGQIMDGGEVLDEVLVSVFRAPHSYTGEDSTEITCHGSAFILQRVLQLLIEHGCRMAQPGEYTQRAFLNGKMDLSQAEAVADVIASDSKATLRMAMNQMRGGFGRELTALTEKLLNFTSLIELELDFSDHEELEFADRGELSALAIDIERLLSRLVESFRVGNALKNGVPVAIIGQTNAGKSTLLNALLHEERAIVSNIDGTTRDSIEETIRIQGTLFRFIDTAGIRSTTDTIESIGIERTFQKLDKAEIVIWMVSADCAEAHIKELAPQVLPHCHDKQLILALNKTDLASMSADKVRELLRTAYPDYATASNAHCLHIARIQAKTGIGMEQLEQLLVECAAIPEISAEDVIVTNIRHHQALGRALDAIHRVQEGLSTGLSGDFVSQDIRECIHHLDEINLAGKLSSSAVLENIFKHFCVGK